MNIKHKQIKKLDAYKLVYRLKGARKAKRVIVAMMRQYNNYNLYDIPDFPKDTRLSGLFVFAGTPEGSKSWWKVTNKVNRKLIS